VSFRLLLVVLCLYIITFTVSFTPILACRGTVNLPFSYSSDVPPRIAERGQRRHAPPAWLQRPALCFPPALRGGAPSMQSTPLCRGGKLHTIRSSKVLKKLSIFSTFFAFAYW